MNGHTRVNRKRRGIVLFMVVAIVLMMTFLTYAFLLAMRTQNLAASQAGDQLQARQAAFSAREMVCGYLEDSLQGRHAIGGMYDNEQQFKDIQLQLEGEEADEFTPSGAVLADPTGQKFGIQNESAKINLKKLLELDVANPGWGRECLMRLPRMTETLADHILDWIDADEESRELGAESDFYLEEFGFRARNDIPLTLEELAKIPGIEPELLFGNERGRNAPTEGPEFDEEFPPWSEFLTVRSAERNETYEGRPRINLNSTGLFDLHTSLVELTNVDIANFVILARQFGLAGLSEDSAGKLDAQIRTPSEYALDLSIAPQFEFESSLDVIGAMIQIGDESEESGNPILIGSPFVRNGAMDELLNAFLDGTDTGEEKILSGRVNVMLASPEVLKSVPGMDDELVGQVLANREGLRNGAKNCFWLLENRLVKMEQMKLLMPHITVRGEVCRFVCTGRSHSSLAPVAFKSIVDATGETARLVSNQKIIDTRSLQTIMSTSTQNR